MTVNQQDLVRFFKKPVILTRTTPGGTIQIEGKVMDVSASSLAIRTGSNTHVIDLVEIEACVSNPRIRKKRVARRWVRIITRESSVKQHLADRHAVLVSVLNAVDEDTAHEMHNNIVHDDLGHRHRSPEDRMQALDGESDADFTDEEDDEED